MAEFTWTFPELNVFNDASDEGSPRLIDVKFTLESKEPDYWEITDIQLCMENAPPLSITETQLDQLFPNGQDMINNAMEAAATDGVTLYD